MSTDINLNQMQKFKEFTEQTNQIKTFFQDSFRIDYENTSKIFYSQDTDYADFKVNNYLCRQEGQELIKITEIIYQNKIIRIEDKLQVFVNSSNVGESCSFSEGKNEKEKKNSLSTIEKVRIFNKNANKNTKTEKKDKKNIVKNIVKIFLSWLEKKENDRLDTYYEISLRELKALMKTENFNNRLIQNIITSRDVNKVFLEFIEDSAENDIKCSRIQDKESYYEALLIYKSLLVKGQNNMEATAVNSEASEQCNFPQEFHNSSETQENSNLNSSYKGESCKSREAGVREIGASKNNIIVIQNEMYH